MLSSYVWVVKSRGMWKETLQISLILNTFKYKLVFSSLPFTSFFFL